MHTTSDAGRTVLVVAAHPDDELLGVGGTVRRHVLAGDEVHCLVLCEGTSLRYSGQDVPQGQHGREAAKILGVTGLDMLDLPDQRLDSMSLVEIVTPIEERVRAHRPEVVYTHFGGDLNRDHRLVFEAVLVACRPVDCSVSELFAFETPSATEWNVPRAFQPDYFVDITDTLETKLRAFACYESEVRPYPHPRSLQHLRHRAHYWGNQVDLDAAEAFVTCRRLWR